MPCANASQLSMLNGHASVGAERARVGITMTGTLIVAVMGLLVAVTETTQTGVSSASFSLLHTVSGLSCICLWMRLQTMVMYQRGVSLKACWPELETHFFDDRIRDCCDLPYPDSLANSCKTMQQGRFLIVLGIAISTLKCSNWCCPS